MDLTILRDDLLERWSGGKQSVGPNSQWVCAFDGDGLTAHMNLTGLHQDEWRAGATTLAFQETDRQPELRLAVSNLRRAGQPWAEDVRVHAKGLGMTTTDAEATWSGPTSGSLAIRHALDAQNGHRVDLSQGQVLVDGQEWNLTPGLGAHLVWQGADWRTIVPGAIHWTGPWGGLHIDAPDSALLAGSNFTVKADGIPAAAIAQVAEGSGAVTLPNLSGRINGHASVRLANGHSLFGLQWQDAQIDELGLGDVCVDGTWMGGWNGSIRQFIGEEERVRLHWTDGQGVMTAFDWPLECLSPLVAEGDLQWRGTVDGTVRIQWADSLPTADGSLTLAARDVRVGATGGQYDIDGTLRIGRDDLWMDQAKVLDPTGNVAWLNLSVLHNGWKDWNYNLGLELPDPFQVLNLPPQPGQLYHGQARASGSINVFGDERGLEVEARARTEQGTQFSLPLDALEGAELPHGIRFVSADAKTPTDNSEDRNFGLALDLEMEVTPEAGVSLILDSRAGERLDGRASGSLNLSMDPQKPLTMEGGLDIVEGSYRFSLRDLFTRRIAIAPGGRIDWDGDPYAAELDLVAQSAHWANPSQIVTSSVRRGKTDVLVDMAIQGALDNPTLLFSIDFPEYAASDPAMLAQVRSALGTQEEIDRQSFALLATGDFLPSESQRDLVLTQAAVSQASELLSSRVSELLTGLSDDVEIGLRYLPANPSSTSTAPAGPSPSATGDDALELDLGVQLMNDRLSIAGSVGTGGIQDPSGKGSQFRGGVEIRYELTPDGRWELIGFSQPESELDENPRHGVGAAFRLRFDRIRDVFRRRPTLNAGASDGPASE